MIDGLSIECKTLNGKCWTILLTSAKWSLKCDGNWRRKEFANAGKQDQDLECKILNNIVKTILLTSAKWFIKRMNVKKRLFWKCRLEIDSENVSYWMKSAEPFCRRRQNGLWNVMEIEEEKNFLMLENKIKTWNIRYWASWWKPFCWRQQNGLERVMDWKWYYVKIIDWRFEWKT